MPPGRVLRRVLLSLGGGLVGGFVFTHLNVPLGWLLGAMCMNIVLSMGGVRVTVPAPVRAVSLAILGVLLGSAFTPDLLHRLGDWVISLVGLIVYLAAVIPLAILYCRKVIGLDRVSAAFSGIPGGLSEMVMLGTSLGGNARDTALAHSSRLVTILIMVPVLLEWTSDVSIDTSNVTLNARTSLTVDDALVLIACGIVGPMLAKLLKLPAAMLTGGLIVSAAAHLTGLTEAKPPDWLIAAVQVAIGASIGTRFGGSRYEEVLRILLLSAGLTLMLLTFTVGFAFGIDSITGLGFLALMLAFTPGGIAEMSLIALLLNIDPVFVAAHHTFRILSIYLSVPIVLRRWLAMKKDTT